MIRFVTFLLCPLFFLISVEYSFGEENPSFSSAQEERGFPKVKFLLDFSDYVEGSVGDWLAVKGFKPAEGAKDRRKIDFDVNDGALIIEAKKRVRGFLINEQVDIEEFAGIRIKWGIKKYARGANYSKGKNNEALMIYIFFGYDKISSGHFLIPNSPYFIGLYLCENEQVNTPYKGNYFHKSGRFICLGKPAPGEIISSDLNLISTFKSFFEKDDVPVITGISLAVDTTSSGDGGKATAFIRSIEFIE